MKMFLLAATLWAHICLAGLTTLADKPLTIWVHGTKLTPTIVCAHFFFRLPGMNPATDYKPCYHKRQLAELLCNIDPEQYALDHFYFFGWSGKLCFAEREKASEDLLQAILKLTREYEEQHQKKPKIRIITHSHGGNVALNLARINEQKQLIIDELILLGCPVQENTKHFIKADCFKKVYAFYSGSDMFQIIDPQGLYKKSVSKKIFSERIFDQHQKLRQAHIKLHGRSLMHIEYLCFPFLTQLPQLCRQIDQWYTSLQDNDNSYEKIMDIKNKGDHTYIMHKFNMKKKQ